MITKTNVFTVDECAEIIRLAENEPFTVVEQGKGESYNLKNLKVSWLNFEPQTQWIFKKLMALVSSWPITRLESLQFTVYGPGGCCDWHIDHEETTHNGAAVDRLCNAIVQLSDPGDYTGGELELRMDDQVLKGPTGQGSALVLDKTIWHRVAPLKSGTRKSLVSWGLK